MPPKVQTSAFPVIFSLTSSSTTACQQPVLQTYIWPLHVSGGCSLKHPWHHQRMSSNWCTPQHQNIAVKQKKWSSSDNQRWIIDWFCKISLSNCLVCKYFMGVVKSAWWQMQRASSAGDHSTAALLHLSAWRILTVFQWLWPSCWFIHWCELMAHLCFVFISRLKRPDTDCTNCCRNTGFDVDGLNDAAAEYLNVLLLHLLMPCSLELQPIILFYIGTSRWLFSQL